jgi:4-amino-4-deoxy-L-arabinose transferase-like glycosyltransferase
MTETPYVAPEGPHSGGQPGEATVAAGSSALAAAEPDGQPIDDIGAGGRPTGRRRLPRLVLLIVALQSFLILCTGMVYTSFQEPDEVAHVDYILAHRHGQWLDGPGERHFQSGVLQAYALVPSTQTKQHVADQAPLKRDERKSFDQLGTAPHTTGLPNQMVQHPPLYYAIGAGFSYLLPNFEGQRFDVQIAWLRFLSLLMMIPVPILAWMIGRRLTGSSSIGVAMAILPLLVPSYLRTGASVSNDVPMVLFGALLLYLLSRVVTGDLSRKTAIWVGVLWALLLLTKGFSLVFPPVIVLAYLCGGRGKLLARIRSAWLPAVLAGVVGAALGGWWWIRNELVYGTVQPYGFGPLWPLNRVYGPDRPGGTERNFLHGFTTLMYRRMFGSLGLIDFPLMPGRLLATLVIVFSVLVLVGIGLGARRAHAQRWSMLMLVLPALLTVAVMYSGSRSVYFHIRQIPGVQVRYFVPFLPGLTLPVAVTMSWLLRRLRSWTPLVAFVGALALEGAATVLVLDLQVGPKGPGLWHRVWGGVKYAVGWAPWPGAVSAVILLVTAVLVLWTLGALVRFALVSSGADRSRPASSPAGELDLQNA